MPPRIRASRSYANNWGGVSTTSVPHRKPTRRHARPHKKTKGRQRKLYHLAHSVVLKSPSHTRQEQCTVLGAPQTGHQATKPNQRTEDQTRGKQIKPEGSKIRQSPENVASEASKYASKTQSKPESGKVSPKSRSQRSKPGRQAESQREKQRKLREASKTSHRHKQSELKYVRLAT